MSVAVAKGRAQQVSGARATGLFSQRSRLCALGLLLLAGFAFGGGSRADITSLIVLRPLSFVLLAYALIAVSWRDFLRLGVPLWAVAGMAGLALLQLAPLPPAIWSSLPGRELPFEIAQLMGWQGEWRPLSLAPSRTLNALFALGVPLAALALLAGLGEKRRAVALWLILAVGALSALLGLAQLMGPTEGPLYLYRITNDGLAVGLFSNRNHHAIFLASLLPLLAYCALAAWMGRNRAGRNGAGRNPAGRSLQITVALGGMAFVVPMVLVTGSRAGAALIVLAAVALAAMLWRYMDAQPSDGTGSRTRRKLVAPLFLAALATLAATTHFAARSLSFERLAGSDVDGGLRLQTLPHLWQMAISYFPAGTGLGAFREAWEIVEPRELLRPQYLNQAHNDLLQIVIEGGAVGLALLLLGLVWFARSGLRALRQFRQQAASGDVPGHALFIWLALAVLLAGSLFDYPLRTPALMLVAVLLAGLLQLSLTSPRDAAPSGRKPQ